MFKLFKNSLTVIGWSTASCGLTLAVLLPGNLAATSPNGAPAAEVTQPKLVENGVELTMRLTDHGRLQAYATNTTDQSVATYPRFECQSLSKPNPLSRVAGPRSIWTHDESISLAPHERKQITFPESLEVGVGNWVMVTTNSNPTGVALLTVPGKAIQ